MQRIIFLLLFQMAVCCSAQTSYLVSDPIDIPQEGWNKVLTVSNGNTLLFHFEPRKGILVKVFDSTHKEVASHKHLCKILDINQLDQAIIRGIYDINGEADLFIEQSYFNNNTLILLRINALDGTLIEERKLVQSASFANKSRYSVLKCRNESGYSVFCMKNLVTHPDDTAELLRFNDKHELIGRVPFNVDTKPYDYAYLVDADIDRFNGAIGISLQLAKKEVSGIHPVFSRDLLAGYLPAGQSVFSYKLLKLPQDPPNVYSTVLYGRFAYSAALQQANLVILSRTSYAYQDGIASGVHTNLNSLFIGMGDSGLHAAWLANDKIAEYAKAYYRDTLATYNGVPTQIFSDDAGNSTVIYEEYAAENTVEQGQNRMRTSLGNTGIAMYNAAGQEVWGMALPKAQSLRSYMSAGYIAERHSFKYLFRGHRPDDYEKQFASIDCYSNKNSYYIFYNDFASNAADAEDSVLKTVYQYNFENAFDNTNAFYYKVDQNREVKKYFLFGIPEKGQSKANFLESADYDERNNTYTTLLLFREGKKATCHIAWCKME